MLRALRLVSLGIALSALLAACGPVGGDADGGPREPKLSVIRDEIFTPRCGANGCHGGDNPSAGLKLDGDGVHAAIVDVDSSRMGKKYVVAGDPDSSFLLAVLKGASDGIPQMPVGGALEAEDVQLVEDWIAAGALDD